MGKRVTLDMGYPWTGEIVGVVGSFRGDKFTGRNRHANCSCLTRNFLFLEARWWCGRRAGRRMPSTRFAVRSRRRIRGAAFYNVRTMKQQVSNATSQQRLRSALIGVFSIVALILAALGLYGLIACAVAERRREFGIRMALGAGSSEIRGMVLGQGLKLTVLGLVIGLIGAAAATRLMEGLLFGVSAGDPLTYLITGAVFLAVAVAATYLPARRATRVDPMTALRNE